MGRSLYKVHTARPLFALSTVKFFCWSILLLFGKHSQNSSPLYAAETNRRPAGISVTCKPQRFQHTTRLYLTFNFHWFEWMSVYPLYTHSMWCPWVTTQRDSSVRVCSTDAAWARFVFHTTSVTAVRQNRTEPSAANTAHTSIWYYLSGCCWLCFQWTVTVFTHTHIYIDVYMDGSIVLWICVTRCVNCIMRRVHVMRRCMWRWLTPTMIFTFQMRYDVIVTFERNTIHCL